jgi:hypothetical protein
MTSILLKNLQDLGVSADGNSNKRPDLVKKPTGKSTTSRCFLTESLAKNDTSNSATIQLTRKRAAD